MEIYGTAPPRKPGRARKGVSYETGPEAEIAAGPDAESPTAEQFAAYRIMFRYFNDALFAGTLPEPLLNLSRGPQKAIAFFAPFRWKSGEQAGEAKHEISLNPRYLLDGTARDTADSLVHEMAHLWQQVYGTPARKGYHNTEWSRKMLEIGLQPINAATGQPAMSAPSMSHRVIEGGAFDRAFAKLPAVALLPFSCVEAQPASSPGGGDGEPEPGGEPAPEPEKPRNKVKYRCPVCGIKVWGKPAIALACLNEVHEPTAFESGPAAGTGTPRPVCPKCPECPGCPDCAPTSEQPPACPADVPACSLGLLGGACGLPAPLVLAAAQGAPVPRVARFCLTSVWNVIPSHDPRRGFAPNPDYPDKVQERDYARDRGEQLKVIGIAQSLVPELVFNGAAGAIDGLPVVTRTGIVLGGNGRTQGLQLHYADGGEVARKYLLDNARQFGFTRAQVEGVADPVVVRVIDTPTPDDPTYRKVLRELVRILNVPLLRTLDVRSESVAEGHRLSDEALEILSVGLSDDQTLAEYLSSRQSRTFADALRRSGILSDRNASRMLNDDGIGFSEDGKVFVERLLTGALVPDSFLLDQAGPQLRGTLARGAPWLLAAAANGTEWDLRPALLAAVRDIIAMRTGEVSSVDAYLRQVAMPGHGPAARETPNGIPVLRILHELAGRPVLFGRFARDYAQQAQQHPTAQVSLLPTEAVTPQEALGRAAKWLRQTKS